MLELASTFLVLGLTAGLLCTAPVGQLGETVARGVSVISLALFLVLLCAHMARSRLDLTSERAPRRMRRAAAHSHQSSQETPSRQPTQTSEPEANTATATFPRSQRN